MPNNMTKNTAIWIAIVSEGPVGRFWIEANTVIHSNPQTVPTSIKTMPIKAFMGHPSDRLELYQNPYSPSDFAQSPQLGGVVAIVALGEVRALRFVPTRTTPITKALMTDA
jgi:hypothetical protein